ncbi:MAG: HAD-IA family hydrolase [Muribaculaceae bacterium]|nr:HAD-IA family hydrolase [Muribaculaceae bacterium]
MNFIPEIERFLKARHFKSVSPLAALIDMDGTLYDSMGNHADAWLRMVTELGIEATRDEFFMYEGRTGASTINIIFRRAYGRDATPEEIEELYHRKTVYFAEMPPVKPMPGAKEMLDTLIRTGIKRVLVTGSGQSSLINRLDTDFPGAFSSVLRVTSRSVTHGKPHPEPFIRAMQLAGAKPSQCIAIENAPLGVKSASDAGVFTIAVTTGPIPRKEMENTGAAVIFPSMEECASQLHILLYQLLTTSQS